MDIEKYFNVDNLKDVYEKKVMYTSSVGTDGVNNSSFMKDRIKHFEKICSDIKEKKYKFKDYRIILIPKDVNTEPRKICIPTVRDRIVIEILKDIIYDIYKKYTINIGLAFLVDKFAATIKSRKYKKYVCADIKHFFDNISHQKLLNKIKQECDEDWLIDLLREMLKTDQKYQGKKIRNIKGVPQGLSIATLLANIYMVELDTKLGQIEDTVYLRYVDDIFVFCNKEKTDIVMKMLNTQTKKISLKLHEKKTKVHSFSAKKNIDFLGYSVNAKNISVKQKSIYKLEKSLEQIFKDYAHSDRNKDRLAWRLNLRICGAVANNKRYGWLFYFSNIDDLKMLYHFDWYISKLKKRYKAEDIVVKSFVTTYYKMKSEDVLNSNYFLNINKISTEEKKAIILLITDYTPEKLEEMAPENIDYVFKKNIFKSLKEVESDLDSLY